MPRKSLGKIADIVAGTCLSLRRNEKFMVVTDENKMSLALPFFKSSFKYTNNSFLFVIRAAEMHGQEPPVELARVLREMDAAILLTTFSLSHTKARKAASRSGVRMASLPGATREMLMRAMEVSYSGLRRKGRRLKKLLEKGKRARIVSKKGTDLTFSIEGKEAFIDDGLYTKKGAFGNLPAGETCIGPVEGTAEGVLVLDGSFPLFGKLEKPFKIYFEKGHAVSFEGKGARKIEEILKPYGKKARNLAEFGIGTNPKAKITGLVLEDEKVSGTVHFALGNNISFGGKVDVPLHLDGVVRNPRLFIDGGEVKIK